MHAFELLDHTADALVRARGDDLGELLVGCAEGMFAVIVEEGEVRERTSIEVELEAEDAEALVHEWLRELLYRSSADGMVFGRFEVHEAEPTRLRATCHGEPADPERHQGTEIKAVTWHGFRVEQTDEGWTAEVLFDI
ncbi:MAG: archease [Planctomycetota bacterium]